MFCNVLSKRDIRTLNVKMIIKAYSNVVARRHVVYIRLCDHDLVVVVAWWVPRRRRYLLGDINMK